MRNQFDIRAFKSGPWVDNLELHIYDRATHSVAINIEFQKAEEGNAYPPVMYIDYTVAQQLMDSLWDCGVRPTEGAGSAGAMKAVQEHLQDMRKIASKVTGVDLT